MDFILHPSSFILCSLLHGVAPSSDTAGYPAAALLGQLPTPTGKDLLIWLGCAACVIVSIRFAMGFAKDWRETFGRKPPLDDSLAELRKQLAGMAPSEKVNAIVDQLGKAAAKEDLAKVLSIIDDKERDLQMQIKDARAYAHDGVHGVREDLQLMVSRGDEAEQRLLDKLDDHWKELNRERSVSTARLHERIEAHSNTLRSELDTKVGELRKEVHDMPSRVVELLKSTGAIGGRRA